MRKIIGFLVIVTIAVMMAINAIAAEDAPATDADTAATEEVTTGTNSMYIPGEAYAGILYTQSDHNLSGTRVIGDSGIGVKGGYFVSDNADISLSYVLGTWAIGTLSAGASEIRLMGNYHYPFVHSSSITLGGLIGVGYDAFNFQSTTTTLGGVTFTVNPGNAAGFVYEAGLDVRMNSLEGYLVYRSGSIAYSTLNTSLTLSCIEGGVNYLFDASSLFAGSGE